VLQCVAVCCSVLQCAARCCSVLQCVAVCCNVCCSVLNRDESHPEERETVMVRDILITHCNPLQYTAITATQCNTLAIKIRDHLILWPGRLMKVIHCNTLQPTATHTLILLQGRHMKVIQCNKLQNPSIHCNTLQHTATHTLMLCQVDY